MLDAIGVEASDELRVLVRPFHAYRALAEEAHLHTKHRWWHRPLLTLFAIGCFVGVSTAGRFVLAHVVFVAIAWTFIPVTQIVWLELARRRWAAAMPFARATHLFFAGQGGWLALIVLAMALVTLAPRTADELTGRHWIMALGSGALAAAAHGILVTVAYLREVWHLTGKRTAAAALTYYLGISATYVSYYVVMGQLLPILPV